MYIHLATDNSFYAIAPKPKSLSTTRCRIIGSMEKNWLHFFELLWSMTEKELRARYKYTIFGFLWLVVNPVLQMLVIGFVFTFFMKQPVQHYYYYLFIGLLVWNFFSLSLTKTTPSIVFERSLIKKAAFPRSVIPLSIIFSNLIHFFVAILLFSAYMATQGAIVFVHFPYIFLGILLLLATTVGLSLFASAVNVRYRDMNFFIQALLIIWFYGTPIIYSLTQAPQKLRWVWFFNPLTAITQLFQYSFLPTDLPEPGLFMINSAICIGILCIGILTFSRESKFFDDWI